VPRDGIVLSGYYGFGNLGDEAVLSATIRTLRARLGDLPVTVLSARPAETAATHGVAAVHRTDPRAVWRALGRARLFLSGGGSLLQDITSARSALYYLGVLALATARVPRTMVYAQGVGPLRRGWVRWLVRRVLDRVDVVTVRDADSRSLLEALRVRCRPTLVADPVWLLDPAPPEALAPRLRSAGVGEGEPLLLVAVRPWRGDRFVGALAAGLREAARRLGARVVAVPFQRDRDLALSTRVAAATGGVLLDPPPAPEEVLALAARATAVVGLRLHALILAARAGTPPVGLAYDPKVGALFRELGLPGPLTLAVEPDALAGAVVAAATDAAVRARLQSALPAMQARAAAAGEVAARLYAGAPPRGRGIPFLGPE